MAGFYIKHTYLDSGKSYKILKGGYVTTDNNLWPDDLYTTKRAAQAVATKYTKQNEYYKKYCPCVYENGIYEVVEYTN